MRTSLLRLAAGIAPLIAIAGCGETATQNTATANSSATAAHLDPGLYEVRAEVTASRVTEPGGTPAFDMPAGSSTTQSICVGAEDRPPAALFAPAGINCTYNNYYGRGGRMNAILTCSKPGTAGNVGITIDGTFMAQSFDAQQQIDTVLAGPGDMAITSHLTGRRTGDCPAGGEAAAATNTQ